MKHIPYILCLLLALTLLVGMRLPFLRCEAFVPGAPLLYDEKDYLHGARSFAAGDTTSDTAEAWIRAPATSWVLLTVARLQACRRRWLAAIFSCSRSGWGRWCCC